MTDKQFWTTANKTKINVSELTDSHILNIGKYFNDSMVDDIKSRELSFVKREAEKRGLKWECSFSSVEDYSSDLDEKWAEFNS